MLCVMTFGWLNGKSSLCVIHFLYIILFWRVHWHKYVLYFFVILYLSFVVFVLWSNIALMLYLIGLFFTLRGGFG